ncbi:MAG: hypothetical protein R3D00_08765 [Bacteroidia bacterium]
MKNCLRNILTLCVFLLTVSSQLWAHAGRENIQQSSIKISGESKRAGFDIGEFDLTSILKFTSATPERENPELKISILPYEEKEEDEEDKFVSLHKNSNSGHNFDVTGHILIPAYYFQYLTQCLPPHEPAGEPLVGDRSILFRVFRI